MASVPGYFYARQDKSIYVNLFASGVAEIKLENGPTVKLTQETRYPWDGAVRIQVSPDKSSKFALRIRVPGWARDEAVPGGLYTFIDKETEQPSLQVNGRPVALKTDDGYAVIERRWKKGDTVLLTLPMPVRRVAAREEVVADRGRVALQRGPLVYCLEWPDNPGVHVPDVVLPDNEKLTAQFEPDLLNGVEIIKGTRVTAIPYYAWANRGKGDMEVWIRDSRQSQSKN
jgi:hypothetical protein